MFWNACTWHGLEDLIFSGHWKNLNDRLRNGRQLVTNVCFVWYLTSITCVNFNSIVVGNTAKRSRPGLFQESDFVGDFEDWKFTSGETLCVFGCHTIYPISWICMNQTSVTYISTESEIISLDAGLRLDGITALDLWDLILLVFGNTNQNHDRTEQPVVNWQRSRAKRAISMSDQDDYKRKKSDSETCFTTPQSCSWLVIRSNQFGPKNPNQVHGHQKQTRWHSNQGKFRCRKERKNIQVKKESQQNRNG